MNKSIKNLTEENYKRFCSLDGSQYIASEFALKTILNLIKRFKLSKILELGLGIGSISDTVLKYNKQNTLNIEYFGTESDTFCLSVLPNYVEHFNDIKLSKNLNQIQQKKFDFVIIDGLDDSLSAIKDYVEKRTILYVEGDRKVQTQLLLDLFPKHKYVNVITLKKNPKYAHESRSEESYIGGGQLIFINPNMLMNLYFFREQLKTFLIRKIRKFNK